MDINLADLVAAVAVALPDRDALVCDGERLTYAELIARSGQVAQCLIDAGISPDETVGLYMPNSIAYVESLLGCMLARAIPANINYRYTGQELAHLFGSARLAGLIVDAEYAAKAAEVAAVCPGLRHVLVAGEADPALPDFGAGVTTAAYGSVAASGRKAFSPENGRSGDDKLLIYTGGTTGLPKGVLWRHEDFYWSALAGGNHYGEPRRSVAEVVAAAEAMPAGGYLLTAPLMHGAGTYTLFTAFLLASTVVISRRFDAANVLSLVGAEKCMAVAIVGDAMARPLADRAGRQLRQVRPVVVVHPRLGRRAAVGLGAGPDPGAAARVVHHQPVRGFGDRHGRRVPAGPDWRAAAGGLCHRVRGG